jgi:hypothetical protein
VKQRPAPPAPAPAGPAPPGPAFPADPAVAHVGDQVLITCGSSPQRDGRVLEVRHGPNGPVYLVEWAEDLVRSVLISGSQVRVRHLFGCGEAPE